MRKEVVFIRLDIDVPDGEEDGIAVHAIDAILDDGILQDELSERFGLTVTNSLSECTPNALVHEGEDFER